VEHVFASSQKRVSSETGAVPSGVYIAHVRPFRVPILMYHYIRELPNPKDRMGVDLSVTPETFVRQLATLGQKGYQSITFDLLANTGAALPNKSIILTFDDGYQDAYTQAFPALLAHHMRGTFYIVTGFLGTPNYLTWNEVEKMKDAGMEIAAHTVTHADLSKLTSDQQEQEIKDSIQTLDEKLQIHVRSLAYPFGHYTNQTMRMTKAAGIAFATTTHGGIATDKVNPMALPRVRIKNRTNFEMMF
jgi:peptidoglycan/xylan/chitin deacetylase (PgdA/CDA1 family)